MRRHDPGDQVTAEAAVRGALMDELYKSEGPTEVWYRCSIQAGESLPPNVIGGTGAGFLIHLFLFFSPLNRRRPRRLLPPPCQSN